MAGPITRTFLRTENSTQHFLEITWQGSEVEVVSGKLGNAGRATSKSFADLAERDAFIAKRIERALREGFVEGSPADVPTPDPVDHEARRADALVKKRQGTTYTPRTVDDDARDASKFGGTPWLEGADSWPICPGCTQPLRFLVQLAVADVPISMRWAFRADLLQLFLCDDAGKPGDAEWICQAANGWEAFARSSVVRHLARTAAPTDMRDALPVAHLELRRRLALEGLASYCRRTNEDTGEEDALAFEARIRSESVDPRLYEPPVDRHQYCVDRAFLFPPKRVVEWIAQTEVPAPVDLDAYEDADALEQRGLRCEHGDKLGGYPCWAQSPAVPRCRTCGSDMRFVLQLVTNKTVPVGIGGDGLGWIFACEACRDATFLWQR